jgi:hypothetical protein
MGYRFLLGLFLAIVVAVVTSANAGAEDLSLQKHARLGTIDADHDRQLEPADDVSLPGWLDDLLAHPLSANNAENQAEPPALEDRGLESESKTGQSDNSDPLFPKPPRIPPLYTSPPLEGEGVWTSEETPQGSDGRPLVYKTVYRPSIEFPNSVVYMALFDISRLKTRLFIGNTEPGMYEISYMPEREGLSKIVAITNALWMQQHARGAGAIFRGRVVYPMVPGMATLVIYRDDSVDIVEWSDDIPVNLVKDARQLRYLLVKDGAVVENIVRSGKLVDSELGLGGFLIDNQGRSTMGNKFWFLANRTAFGIRDDGNLIFAMGHHVSTKDLARALALAGCKRAIHGDANIHNIVCNFYFRSENDKIVKRERLSPEQLQYTLKRYDQGYGKDFFAFYEKE